MSAFGNRAEWNDSLSCCQVYSNHFYKYVWLRALVRMEWYIKFLPSVIESLAQVCLPRSIGMIGVIYWVPVKCNLITCTSMAARYRWPQWNDTLSSYEVWSNQLYKYVCLRALVKMEWYIKLLPCVEKSLVQVCLPIKSLVQVCLP
jgi:hypothetical protein